MIKITLPDGAIKEYEKGSSALDVAKSISDGLARMVLAAKVNNEIVDPFKPLE
ncbi:MAG: threonyl-tRNA synthetase, partial [Arenicella sp.]